jgi:type IV secretion system protein TrbI
MTGPQQTPVRAQPPKGRLLDRRGLIIGGCLVAALFWFFLIYLPAQQAGRKPLQPMSAPEGQMMKSRLHGITRYQDMPTPPPEVVAVPPPPLVQAPPPQAAPPPPQRPAAAATGRLPEDPYQKIWGKQGAPQKFTGAIERNLREEPTAHAALQETETDAGDQGLDQNRRFMQRAGKPQETRLGQTLQPSPSPYTIHAGWFIPAVLYTGAHSDLPGELKAYTRQPIFDSATGRHLLIPQGTTLVGTYNHQLAYAQDRVLVVWTRLIYPEGKGSLSLEGMPGVDLSGMSGLTGKVNHHTWQLFKAVLLSSVLSMGARAGAGTISYDDGVQPHQDFLRDFSAGANRAGQQMVQRVLMRQPTVEIKPGAAFNVIVTKDIVLPPHGQPLARR